MSSKKTYHVHVPVVMEIIITVEAESEDAAIESAWSANFGLEVRGKDSECVEISEWEMHSRVVSGNVYSGCINEIFVGEG